MSELITEPGEDKQAEGRVNKTFLIPLGVFLVLVVILAIGFKLEDPHLLPSVLIDRPFPAFNLKELHDENRIVTREDLMGDVSLVNVWATWCPNCIIEHPEFMRIARDEGVPIYGINYNDERDKAIRWLERNGDPYTLIMEDNEGKLGIDLGVYGAPETFVVDAAGVIQYKHVGAVTRNLWEQTLSPLIDHLRENKQQKVN